MASPRSKMSSVLRLILPGGELPGGELLAAPWALRATPLQNPRNAKTPERKTAKAINGQLLVIGSRTATVAAATSTSVAKIEFAASQKRPAATKLNEKEGDEAAEFRLCPASGEKLLMYRLTLVVTLIIAFFARDRSRFSLQAPTKSRVSNASRFAQ